MNRAFLPGFEKRVPFTTALVELDEDPSVRLATMLDESAGEPLRIGLPLEVYFETVSEALVLPRFRPRRARAATAPG